MEERIKALAAQLESDAGAVNSKAELSEFWQKYLGKAGCVAELMKRYQQLTAAQKG